MKHMFFSWSSASIRILMNIKSTKTLPRQEADTTYTRMLKLQTVVKQPLRVITSNSRRPYSYGSTNTHRNVKSMRKTVCSAVMVI